MASLEIQAPMAGAVKQILVSVGDKVTSGQEVVILESMKMEIPVESTVAGSVAALHVTAGDRIVEGQVLLLLET